MKSTKAIQQSHRLILPENFITDSAFLTFDARACQAHRICVADEGPLLLEAVPKVILNLFGVKAKQRLTA